MSAADPTADVALDVTLDVDAVRALAGALLPGDEAHPSAVDLDVAEQVVARADAVDRSVLRGLVATLAAGTAPVAALRALEASDRRSFRRVVQLTYAAYYAHPSVRRLLEEQHGYPDRPPQPLGYAPDPGLAQLARLEERRIHTLDESEWWLPTFVPTGGDAPEASA